MRADQTPEANRNREREIVRRAKKIDRRFPGMRPILCALCREGHGTLERAGTYADGKTRYVHKGHCPKRIQPRGRPYPH